MSTVADVTDHGLMLQQLEGALRSFSMFLSFHSAIVAIIKYVKHVLFIPVQHAFLDNSFILFAQMRHEQKVLLNARDQSDRGFQC